MKRNNEYLEKRQQYLIKRRKCKKISDKYENVNRITNHIYLGNKHIAKDIYQLMELGITHIVNCAIELKYITDMYNDNFDWIWLPMEDCSITGNVTEHIKRTVKYIDCAIQNGNKVLVHCAAGISRSSSIVIAYLMYKNKNATFEEVYDHVVSKRSCCRPNSAFKKQLQEFHFETI